MKSMMRLRTNPTVEQVKNGVQAAKDAGADYLIAIGGGSPQDTCKGIGIILANPEFEDVVSLEGVAPTKKQICPSYRYCDYSRYCSRNYNQLCNYRY